MTLVALVASLLLPAGWPDHGVYTDTTPTSRLYWDGRRVTTELLS